jgi:hypothetical protein
MLYRTILLAALLSSPAIAQDTPPAEIQQSENDQTAYFFPAIPDREVIAWALKRAYQLNGNSMVGNNHMIDLSKEKPFSVVVKTEKMTVEIPAPVPTPVAKPVEDTCTRHGLHKITHGKSWRCK